MRLVTSRLLWVLIAAALIAPIPLRAQQDPFRWMDFHSEKDQSVVTWVTRALAVEKWTAIREIGVQYDAALVVTTLRPSPQSPAASDTFTVWSVSLTTHEISPLLTGVNLRLLDWMHFADGRPLELAALYDDCHECTPATLFAAFHYAFEQHAWAVRWMRGTQALLLWSAGAPKGATLTQVNAALAEPNGREMIATWSHFEFGPDKDDEDYIYQYDVDPFSGLERTQRLNAKQAEAMKQRLCGGPGVVPSVARGQDSQLCHDTLKLRPERKPVTTPPANNRGQSTPPKPRH